MIVRVLITGGTIDKAYNAITGELTFAKTHIITMLNHSRLMVDTLPEVLFLKDSLKMTISDRELILSKCLASNEDYILISHGTDTMAQTAQLLGKNIHNKTIVLFGAMMPYTIYPSDALFNLGFALSSVQTQPSGVYIAMHGKIFDFDKVQKNTTLGIFESI